MSNPYTYTTSAGKTYYLNAKQTRTGGGKVIVFHYFSKAHKPETSVSELPPGHTVSESNHMPILKRCPTN